MLGGIDFGWELSIFLPIYYIQKNISPKYYYKCKTIAPKCYNRTTGQIKNEIIAVERTKNKIDGSQ